MTRCGSLAARSRSRRSRCGERPARAQAGGDRFLGEASSEGPAACPAVTLRFTVPVRFTGVASAEPGVTRLRVEPAVPGNFAARDLLAAPAGASRSAPSPGNATPPAGQR